MRTYTGVLVLTMALLTGPPRAQAQVRQDINSILGPDQTLLVNAMMDYIDAGVVQQHCNMSMITGDNIHSDWDFLPFHRTYLEGMEDYLWSLGPPYRDWVPLPKWDPNTPTPFPFRVVDPDCGSFTCDFGAAATCLNPHNWDPQQLLPPHLQLTVQPGPLNDLCDFNTSPTFPDPSNGGDCCPNGLSRRIEWPYHDNVHIVMRDPPPAGGLFGVMGNFRSPAAPIFWLWHAYVDDIWKRWEMNCPVVALPTVDLYMKDTPKVVESERDRGEEPNIDNGPMWVSEDIWVRRDEVGGVQFLDQEHQDPDHYTMGGTNRVYVRVRNRGSTASAPGIPLNLYWAKAATALSWDSFWNGSITTPALMGEQIDVPHSLPSIPAGGSWIEVFEWNAPDPAIYGAVGTDPIFWANEPWHFCLLARVVDGLPMPETSDLNGNVKNNNNIIWKNLSVVNITGNIVGNPWPDDKIFGASVMTGDAWGNGGTFDLVFKNPSTYKGNPITEEAEVRVTLDAPLWSLLEAGGMQMENMRVSREERFQLIVTGNPAKLKNITYPPGRRYLAHVSFNFLAKKLSGQPEFDYDMVQEKNGAAVGGERYHIIVPGRPGFYADAGPDKNISPSTATDLSANGIGEPAIYNWYDPDGNLIHTGSDLSVSPEISTKYKLEVIAETDGVKDYDEVEVKVKEHEITNIAPNPTIGTTLVHYRLTNATSAYLVLTMPYSGVNNQYILNVAGDQTTLNLDALPPGVYTLILVVNGLQKDVRTLTVL